MKSYLIYGGFFNRLRDYYFGKIIKDFEVTPEKSVLDFGCGPGDLLGLLQKVCPSAIGIDSSIRSVNLAEKKGVKNVYLGDQASPLITNQKYDLIIAQSVLEHVNNPIELFSHLYNALNKNGTLLISVPTPSSGFWDDPTHVRPFTPKSFNYLESFIEDSIIEVNYVAFYLLGIRISSALFYKALNWIPLSLGTNLIVKVKKA